MLQVCTYQVQINITYLHARLITILIEHPFNVYGNDILANRIRSYQIILQQLIIGARVFRAASVVGIFRNKTFKNAFAMVEWPSEGY